MFGKYEQAVANVTRSSSHVARLLELGVNEGKVTGIASALIEDLVMRLMGKCKGTDLIAKGKQSQTFNMLGDYLEAAYAATQNDDFLASGIASDIQLACMVVNCKTMDPVTVNETVKEFDDDAVRADLDAASPLKCFLATHDVAKAIVEYAKTFLEQQSGALRLATQKKNIVALVHDIEDTIMLPAEWPALNEKISACVKSIKEMRETSGGDADADALRSQLHDAVLNSIAQHYQKHVSFAKMEFDLYMTGANGDETADDKLPPPDFNSTTFDVSEYISLDLPSELASFIQVEEEAYKNVCIMMTHVAFRLRPSPDHEAPASDIAQLPDLVAQHAQWHQLPALQLEGIEKSMNNLTKRCLRYFSGNGSLMDTFLQPFCTWTQSRIDGKLKSMMQDIQKTEEGFVGGSLWTSRRSSTILAARQSWPHWLVSWWNTSSCGSSLQWTRRRCIAGER